MSNNTYIDALKYFRKQPSAGFLHTAIENTFNHVRHQNLNLKPDTLSHYCSSSTAIKILEKWHMWLTDIRKMNDESELIYAIDLLNNGAGNLTIDDPEFSGLPKIIREDMNRLLGQSEVDELSSVRDKIILATCFSTHHDDANMWRLYGEGASGVEICFNSKHLASVAGSFNYFLPNNHYETGLVKVCYQGDSCNCLQKLGNQVVEAYREAKSNTERSVLRTLIYYSVSDFLMSHKNPSFKGEGEYRLFTHIPIEKTWHGSDFLMDHPNGKTQYTPFVFGSNAYGYRGLSELLPELIQSVNLGPHIDHQHKDVLESSMTKWGLEEKLKSSTIPIRK